MMELKNIMKLLGGLGIPIAYHHFAEGESPEPPFLIYLTPEAIISQQMEWCTLK